MFEEELAKLLNKHNFDTECNMPDFILAEFIHCLIIDLRRMQQAIKRYES